MNTIKTNPIQTTLVYFLISNQFNHYKIYNYGTRRKNHQKCSC